MQFHDFAFASALALALRRHLGSAVVKPALFQSMAGATMLVMLLVRAVTGGGDCTDTFEGRVVALPLALECPEAAVPLELTRAVALPADLAASRLAAILAKPARDCEMAAGDDDADPDDADDGADEARIAGERADDGNRGVASAAAATTRCRCANGTGVAKMFSGALSVADAPLPVAAVLGLANLTTDDDDADSNAKSADDDEDDFELAYGVAGRAAATGDMSP